MCIRDRATTEEVGRELHRIAKTYRNEAYGTVVTYAGLNLLVRSEYSIDGTFAVSYTHLDVYKRQDIYTARAVRTPDYIFCGVRFDSRDNMYKIGK